MIAKMLKDKRLTLIFISSFVWGIVAHGMAFFYKFSFHDDVLWTVGFAGPETFGLGRWGLDVMGRLACLLFGDTHSSTPAFNGILTVACIAILLFVLCYRLDIKNKPLIVALSGVMVCFPAITALFGFMYTAPYYFVALMLGLAGAYLFYEKKSTGSLIVCSILMALSVSVYQANIPILMMILLLFMFDEVYRQEFTWKEYIVLGLKNALICILFMGIYLGFNKVLLAATGLELQTYKGVSSFGMTDPFGYIYRIFCAYKRFLMPADYITDRGVSANMFPWQIRYFHWLLIIASLILIFAYICRMSGVTKKIQTGLIILISPFFAYFIYFMVGEPEVHGLMTFGEAVLFVVPAYVIERLSDGEAANTDFKEKAAAVAGKISIVLMLFIAVSFARYANVCYLKAEVMQSDAISYFGTLITRIETTEGYTKDTPVLYINDRNKNDESFPGETMFDPIYLPPYHRRSLINDFAWEQMMYVWCGFSPVKAQTVPDEKAIGEMPSYPDEGSIKMIDGILVVKFAD